MGAEFSSRPIHGREARLGHNKGINNLVSGKHRIGGEEAYWQRIIQSQLKRPTS